MTFLNVLPPHMNNSNFFPGLTVSSNSAYPISYTWTKPRGISFIRIIAIGAGGCGGFGQASGSGLACGGSGGCSGAITTATYPEWSVPDTLYIYPGAAAQGAVTPANTELLYSVVSTRPNSNAHNMIVAFNGRNGITGTVGTTPTTLSPTIDFLAGSAYNNFFGGCAGSVGDNGALNVSQFGETTVSSTSSTSGFGNAFDVFPGTGKYVYMQHYMPFCNPALVSCFSTTRGLDGFNIDSPSSNYNYTQYMMLTPGTGGGSHNTNTASNGIGMSLSNTWTNYLATSTFPGGLAAVGTANGSPGSDGIWITKPIMLGLGGTGGGAVNSTSQGTTGGKGGNGAYGCGGGGGGAGRTVGGTGGDGGPGLIIISTF